MSIRPPKALASRNENTDPLTAALEHEVLAEKAATYGRLLVRLEQALEALRVFEAQRDSIPFAPASLRPQERTGETEHDRLLAAAGEALWHMVIQRDLCGLRDHEMFYREYDIPARVRLRMGPRPRSGR